jgi:ABC-2 type transport system permease protein
MKILSIIYYRAVKNLKDVKAFLFIVALPILLIVILGTALESHHSPRSLEKAEIAYLNQDSGEASQQVTAFLDNKEIKDLIAVRLVEDYEEGVVLLSDGQIESFLYIPQGFSEAVVLGDKATIHVLSNAENPIAKSLLQNYLIRLNGAFAVISAGGVPGAASGGNHVEAMAITTDGKVPRAIDYYAVQTLLQVLSIGALFGIATMREDEEKHTLIRIKSAPVKPYELLAGRTVANIIVLFSQALFVMIFATTVYNANWGGSIFLNLLVIFIFVVLTIGIGLLLGTLIKSHIGAIGAVWGIMFFFSVTGGAFGGTINDTLAKLSPNHYAATAIFNNVFAGSSETIQSSVSVLLLAIAVIYALILLMNRRRFA